MSATTGAGAGTGTVIDLGRVEALTREERDTFGRRCPAPVSSTVRRSHRCSRACR
jgi:hypothetical protein